VESQRSSELSDTASFSGGARDLDDPRAPLTVARRPTCRSRVADRRPLHRETTHCCPSFADRQLCKQPSSLPAATSTTEAARVPGWRWLSASETNVVRHSHRKTVDRASGITARALETRSDSNRGRTGLVAQGRPRSGRLSVPKNHRCIPACDLAPSANRPRYSRPADTADRRPTHQVSPVVGGTDGTRDSALQDRRLDRRCWAPFVQVRRSVLALCCLYLFQATILIPTLASGQPYRLG